MRFLGLLALLAVSVPVARQMTAEVLFSFSNHARRARDINTAADLLRRANEMRPQDINYAAARCDLLENLGGIFPQHRAAYTKRALRAAALAVQAHPHDPGAFELMASVELRAAKIWPGLNRAALRSAKRAVELDPLMSFSASQWLHAAILVGDRVEERKARAHLEMVRGLKK